MSNYINRIQFKACMYYLSELNDDIGDTQLTCSPQALLYCPRCFNSKVKSLYINPRTRHEFVSLHIFPYILSYKYNQAYKLCVLNVVLKDIKCSTMMHIVKSNDINT